MDDFRNKWIFAGSLGVVFLITLGFSGSSEYGTGLLGFLSGYVTKSPILSPSDMVTQLVTSKKLVTLKSVTSVTSVSPSPTQSIYSNYGGSIYYQSPTMTPIHSVSPTPSHIATLSPTPSPIQSVAPVYDPTPTETPSLTPTPQPETPTPTPLLESTPTPTPDNSGNVVINEVAWMGTTSSANDEWIELYNPTGLSVSLDGWTLNSTTGTSPDPRISLSGTIPPHGYIILERTNDTTIKDIIAFKIYTGALNDSGEALELRDNNGNLLDSIPKLDNTWFAGEKNNRSSMERISPLVSGRESSNWVTNNGIIKNGHDAQDNPINGTPGSANSAAIL